MHRRRTFEQVDGYAQLPSVSSTDISEILAGVQSVLHHIDTATAGPELGHAIKELDRTLTNFDHLTADAFNRRSTRCWLACARPRKRLSAPCMRRIICSAAVLPAARRPAAPDARID
jgi:hypothetical protein